MDPPVRCKPIEVRRRLPFGTYVGTGAISIRRIEDAFCYFSIDMRRRIKQAQQGNSRRPPATLQREAEGFSS
jgi:hypothetical protein